MAIHLSEIGEWPEGELPTVVPNDSIIAVTWSVEVTPEHRFWFNLLKDEGVSLPGQISAHARSDPGVAECKAARTQAEPGCGEQSPAQTRSTGTGGDAPDEGRKGIGKTGMTTARRPWKMPKWMELYRSDIKNTGGNTIEELVNGNTDPVVNLPVSTLEVCVKSQVSLLYQLRGKGMIPLAAAIPFCPKCGTRVMQAGAVGEDE